jgi:hypothetical protein
MLLAEHCLALRDDAVEWCQGKSCLWRVPILLYLAYAGFYHLTDPLYGSIFSGITLGIHELGHVILSFAGKFLMAAGGTLARLAAPACAALSFLYRRDYFGVSVAGAWLSFSMFGMATYIGDANALVLPLVALGDEADHDWAYLLETVGLIDYDRALAAGVRIAAFAILLGSLALGAWLCLMMARSKRSEPPPW